LSDGATAVPTPARTAERRVAASPLLFCWLLAAAVTTLPHALAALLPPPGRAFVGTFHWIDDFHNYLSFVQQAENGRFLFENKLLLEDHAPALVNLEWWAVGRLSWLLGGRPFLAYRVFALPALAGLLWAADRALRRLGVPASHRLASLLLVATGGGLGGMLFVLTPATVQQCVDLSIGLFPFLQALANPHWLFATWILLEALLAFGETGRGALWRSVLLGNLVGLSRPYDFVLLVAVQSLAIAATAPAREWPRRALPLLGLLPVVAYDYWVFYVGTTFATWTRTSYYMPPAREFVPALGPALALALPGLRASSAGGDRFLRVQLGAWILVVLSLIVVRPTSFTQQFTVGVGVPALVLAARFLARVTRPALMLGVVLLFTSTAVVALRIVLRSEPHWHVPRERLAAALALRPFCRSGEVVMAPADIGLYVMGRTACRAYLSHAWAPGFARRSADVAAFYSGAAPPERAAMLEALGVSYVVLPGDPGPVPEAWLGSASAFRQLARVGTPPGVISVYGRHSRDVRAAPRPGRGLRTPAPPAGPAPGERVRLAP